MIISWYIHFGKQFHLHRKLWNETQDIKEHDTTRYYLCILLLLIVEGLYVHRWLLYVITVAMYIA